MRFDILHKLENLIEYLQQQGVSPVYAGLVPPTVRLPYAVVTDGSADIVQDDLLETDGSTIEWELLIYADTPAQLEPLVLSAWAALNRPGEVVEIGDDLASYCRVTGDGFATELRDEGGEVSRLTYNMTFQLNIYSTKED